MQLCIRPRRNWIMDELKVNQEVFAKDVSVETPTKSPRYKQCYRLEWESRPDYKGWLKRVPNEPTRAYCTYCEKSLHAHRLSLLKHASTLKHTKAAESVNSIKNAADKLQAEIISSPPKTCNQMQDDLQTDDEEAVDDVNPVEEHNTGEPTEDAMEPTGNKLAKMDPTPSSTSSPGAAWPLSTHVLDTAKGSPVGGLQVSLYKLIDGRWTHLCEAYTSPEGRCSNFIQKADFTAGRYKLHFDVDRYFELRKQETLYPFIEIVFDVKSPQEHYHIPLLLSPFGYTTYRGS